MAAAIPKTLSVMILLLAAILFQKGNDYKAAYVYNLQMFASGRHDQIRMFFFHL
jgi:hypothetical protein